MEAGFPVKGMKVRFTKTLRMERRFTVLKGEGGTILDVVSPQPGAQYDMVYVHPNKWPAKLCTAVGTDILEVAF